ncbi:hypothetical protein BC831DRAFT_442540 [Entophlyctis helioformis]|nr:hypothetical protein BC831DRAFT_442540 [Entophlyctis helioformis]
MPPLATVNRPIDGAQPPQGRSEWDRLPMELRLHIFTFVGLLTRFINGMLGPPSRLSIATVHGIWLDAFALDWPGDLATLPNISLVAGDDGHARGHAQSAGSVAVPARVANTPTSLPLAKTGATPVLQTLATIDMLLVRSRSMFHRLCVRFPAQHNQHNPQHFPPSQSHHQTQAGINSRQLAARDNDCAGDLVSDLDNEMNQYSAELGSSIGLDLRHIAVHRGADRGYPHSARAAWLGRTVRSSTRHCNARECGTPTDTRRSCTYCS